MEEIKMITKKELPDDMTGHIVVFDEPLNCGIFPPEKKNKDGSVSISIIPIDYVRCRFMRVSGGFGAKKICMGSMLIGDFYKSIKDIKNNKIATSGNTKVYPSEYIPELYKEVEE